MTGPDPRSVWQRPLPRAVSLLAWGLVAVVTTTAASWCLPGRCGCGRRANESAAIATLRNLAEAEARYHAGHGRFGRLEELADPAPGPPLLSPAFRAASAGRVTRAGYVFQVFLPGPDGSWRSEPVASDAQQRFCAYAWPARVERQDRRVFFVDQSGSVWAAANTHADGHDLRYLGAERPVAPDAAFAHPGGRPGPGERNGQDQQIWRAVQ